jgi:hypothetical protein
MSDIIRDPMWQFFGVIFVVISIIVSGIFFRLQRQRSALSWKIISNTPLVRINSEVKGNLQVLFNGNPVKDIQLLIIKIINTGNVSIKSGDYERPLNLNFDENAQILAAEVIETNPNNIEVSANIEERDVFISPTLLNKGDSFTIKILVNQFNNKILIDSRIVGVKEIQKIVEKDITTDLKFLIIGILIGMIAAVISGIIIKVT